MRKIIKNNYKIIIGFILGLIVSITTVYAVDAYIESNKVTYNNHNKNNVEEAIDELYEKSGIHKEKWIDPILNGAYPVLKEPLIPVEIKPNGEVYYANLNSEWYNYSEKRWANAVILIDNPSNTNYKAGDHIIEDDIESYFVWIPRYQYKIWDLGQYTSAIDASTLEPNSLWKLTGDNTRIIDIVFGDISRVPKMNESEADLNKYYTHPAFTLGDKDLNGIWVGKFETGYKGADSPETAKVDKEESLNIIIKPDVYAWRGIKVRNIFMTSYNYKSIENIHNDNLDPHMMKNIEWGAVVYLSHSIYGIGNKINLNNAIDYKTGYSASANTNQSTRPATSGLSTNKEITQPWNTLTGYLASTTGNISGIYDMSGGTWEFMASCIEGSPGDSGFTLDELSNYMDKNYIDRYDKDSNIETYNKRKLGDATGELGPFFNYTENDSFNGNHSSWYGDYTAFVGPGRPWFGSGASYNDGSMSGQFYFDWDPGMASEYGFRITLAVK